MFVGSSVFDSCVPVSLCKSSVVVGNVEREGLLIHSSAVQTPKFPVIDSQA